LRQCPQRRCEEAHTAQEPHAKTATKRDKTSGEFMAVKKSPVKYKGVRKEK
jgi:hypothetical protein